MEGRIFPPLQPPLCRDVLQARFASDCLALLWLPCPSTRDEPPKCDRTRRDSPAGEVPPLRMHQGPPVPPGPQGCACCTGQGQAVAVAHSGPLMATSTKFSHRIVALAWHCKAGGLPRQEGQKFSSPVALTLALTNALSKKLLQKLGLEGKRFFPWESAFPSHCG